MSRQEMELPGQGLDMTLAEALAIMRIHSIADRTGARTAVITTRSCRAPPHTLAEVALIGGGRVPMPGEGH